eukprot:4437265-Pyramimonas_sp.AAC.2
MNGQGARRPWRDAMVSLTEIPLPDWGMQGPCTTLWCCRWSGGGSLDHHRLFLILHRLNRDSCFKLMHEFGTKALETVGTRDSLDVPSAAGIEALAREVELVEYAYSKHGSSSRSLGRCWRERRWPRQEGPRSRPRRRR